MTYKTRKHIWPLALMSLAVFGVLAAVVALSVGPAQVAQAHPCDTGTIQDRAQCDTEHENDGLDSTDPDHEHPVDTNNAPTVSMALEDMSLRIGQPPVSVDVSGTFEDADGDTLAYSASSDSPRVANATIAGSQMTVVAGDTRGTARITVTANDGNDGMASTSFTVTVAEAYTLTADPVRDAMLPSPATPDPYAALRALPADAIFVVTELGAYDAKFHLAVAGSADDVTVTVTASEPDAGGITINDSDGLIGAGFVDDEETDLEGSLTVKATDQGSRAFEIEGVCVTAGAWAEILVEDKDLDLVAEGAIYCKAPEDPPLPPDEITASECYSVTAYIGDDEDETMDEMRDDLEPHERPAHPTNPEMGQDTIQILEGSTDVQITVTSCEPGPVYIRFLDSDGDVFGTDIDECETCTGAAGADVVGLDSQQKLELNLTKELDAAKALMYDQYNVVTPGDGSDKYLAGKSPVLADGSARMYYQGKFRFMAPCDWEPFQIEVYENKGKVLQEMQNGMTRELVSCVAPEVVEAQPISVKQGSRDRGEMIIEWEPIADAMEYTVAVIDTTDPAMYTLAYFESFAASADRITTADGLTSGTRYIYAVYAELTSGGYSPVEYVVNTPEFTAP